MCFDVYKGFGLDTRAIFVTHIYNPQIPQLLIMNLAGGTNEDFQAEDTQIQDCKTQILQLCSFV
jgi:hypothetical protein